MLNSDGLTIKNYLRFSQITYSLTDIEHMDVKAVNGGFNQGLHSRPKGGTQVVYPSSVLSKKEWLRFTDGFNSYGFVVSYSNVMV